MSTDRTIIVGLYFLGMGVGVWLDAPAWLALVLIPAGVALLAIAAHDQRRRPWEGM